MACVAFASENDPYGQTAQRASEGDPLENGPGVFCQGVCLAGLADELRGEFPASAGRRDSFTGYALLSSLLGHIMLAVVILFFGWVFSASQYAQYPMVVEEIILVSSSELLSGDGLAKEADETSAKAVQEPVQVPSITRERSTAPKPQEKVTREPRVSRPKPVVLSENSSSHQPSPAPTTGEAASNGSASDIEPPSAGGQAQHPGGSGLHGGGQTARQYEGEFGHANGPRFARKVPPRYPAQAKRMGKQGVVVLRLTIDDRGILQGVEILERVGAGLDEEAASAVKASTFHPAMKDGRSIPSRAILHVRFQFSD